MQPRAPLPPAMQATFARRLLASRTLDFAGLWPLQSPQVGEKILRLRRAQGVRSQSMVTMLPAGGSPRGFAELPQARLPHQEHALLRRRGQTRHPLRRSVRVSCVRVHAWLALSAPRGLRRAVYHCSPRGTLCIYPSITSYRLLSQRIGRAFGRSRSLGVPFDCARFPRISRFGASKRPKFSGLAGAHGHRLELGLYTRKNRPLAELVEPAERHTICSHSKKSAM